MTIADAAASGLAAVACIADVGWRRVPNVVTFGGAALALLIAAGTGGVSAFGLALAALALTSVLSAVTLKETKDLEMNRA